MPTSIPWTVPAAKSADQSSPARNSRKPLLRSSLLGGHRGKSRGQVCISQGICSSPSLRPSALFVISAEATTILHDWSTIQQTVSHFLCADYPTHDQDTPRESALGIGRCRS